MRSVFVRIFFVAAAAWGVAYSVRMYKHLPAKTKAELAMVRMDYKAAIRHWNTVREQDPSAVKPVLEMAFCFYELGDKATASMLYRAVKDDLVRGNAPFEYREHQERLKLLEQQGY